MNSLCAHKVWVILNYAWFCRNGELTAAWKAKGHIHENSSMGTEKRATHSAYTVGIVTFCLLESRRPLPLCTARAPRRSPFNHQSLWASERPVCPLIVSQ